MALPCESPTQFSNITIRDKLVHFLKKMRFVSIRVILLGEYNILHFAFEVVLY